MWIVSDVFECQEKGICLNNGTCVDTTSSYYCLCENGWTGDNCEIGKCFKNQNLTVNKVENICKIGNYSSFSVSEINKNVWNKCKISTKEMDNTDNWKILANLHASRHSVWGSLLHRLSIMYFLLIGLRSDTNFVWNTVVKTLPEHTHIHVL